MAVRSVAKKIRIGKLVTTPMGLVYLVIGILLISTLVLPWVNIGVYIKPNRTRDTYRGEYTLTMNGLGMGEFRHVLLYFFDIKKNNFTEIENTRISIVSGIALTFGALVLIGALMAIIMFLKESMLLPKRILNLLEKRERTLSIASACLPLIGSLLFGILHDSLDLPLEGISTISMFKKTTLLYQFTAEEQYRAVSIVSGTYNIGIGAVLSFMIAVIYFTIVMHKYIFSGLFNLRRAWKLRADAFLVLLIVAAYPWAHEISINETKTWIGLATYWGMLATIAALAGLLIILASSKIMRAGVLMREEEFIALTLPPEELARRAKLLPIYVSNVRKVNFLVIVLWILILAFFIIEVRHLTAIYTKLAKEGLGYIFTELPTWMVLVTPLLGLSTHTLIE